MNEVLRNILTRRSVRAFDQSKEISKEVLEKIVTAGMFAPTARNRQLTLFTAVSNPVIIEELQKVMGLALDKADYNFYFPKAIIITSCPRDSKFVKEDTSCALQNMFLYAHSVGLGSVWINQLSVICDDEMVRKVLTSLDIPQDHQCGGMAALGYPLSDDNEKDITRKCKAHYYL